MRWIVRFVVLLLLVAVVAGVSLMMLPGERIARIASDQISALTGREVTLQGDTRISLYPILGVSTGAVTVANADWGEGGPMFRAESLKIGVEPKVLWGGDIRITGLEAVGPVINLERAADGRVNWELGVEGVAPSGQAGEGGAPATFEPLALTLDRALITGATLRYTDHGSGDSIAQRNMDFDLRWPEYKGRATFDITLRPAAVPVRISGYLDRLGDFLEGAVTDLEATVKAGSDEARFVGRLSAEPQAEGRLTASSDDTAGLMAALGLPAIQLPAGLGRSVTLDTRLTFSADQRLSLRDLALGLDRSNRITGAADLRLDGAKPRITAKLAAGELDLSGLSGGQDAGSTQPGAAGQGWSKAPIDASALGLVNGKVSLAADRIDLGDLNLGQTQVVATLDRSRLVLDLKRVDAYAARVSGNFVVNNRSGLSMGGDMDVNGLNVKAFLTDAAGFDRLSGTADADVSFLGMGASQHAIINSLSGKGSFRTGRGVIAGIDLDKLMRSGQASGGTTIFDEMSASFIIKDGRLRNDDLVMKLPLARAEGEGVIGLGRRDIDYLFTPVLLEGETRQGLAIPIRIKGPWADPSIVPDMERAIELNFKEEKKELEKKAKEEVRQAVEDKLGVKAKDGQSTEDAVKEKVEDKLKNEVQDGLKKLFE